MSSDLLQSFQVLSELGVNTVGDELRPGALADVSLSVEEPLGNVVIYRGNFSIVKWFLTGGLGKDVVDLINICFNEFSSSKGKDETLPN